LRSWRGKATATKTAQIGASLQRMHRTEDIATVAAEAFEVIEEGTDGI
jgi:hypothetical protein